jgi:energy-coupling factor transporter ATP-binding protein EcfA2
MFLEKVLKNRVAKVTNDITDIFTDTENGKRFLLVLGRAGTGKSTLLRKLAKHSRKNIAIVAPTGIAAVNVGGETIHSFFKFKPGIMFEEASKNGQNTQNVMYEKLDLLIIDEISMVRADLLDSIDVFLRHARKKNEPFGGVQVVCFGDMYQLEPVVSNDEKDMLYIQYDSPYFFSSRVFNELLFFPSQLIEFVELTKVYRQTDEEFISLLDKIRKKKADEYDLYKINERFAEYVSDTMEGHIYLTTRNDSAARINTKNLELIPEPEYSYLGTTEGDFPDKLLPTDWDLKLKLGARVMLINNDTDKRWINGTLGYVSKLENDAVFVKLDNGNEHAVTRYTWSYYKYVYDKSQDKVIKQLIGSYTQFPLKLAWAITIHKSQITALSNV